MILLLPVMLTEQSLPLISCQSGSKDAGEGVKGGGLQELEELEALEER